KLHKVILLNDDYTPREFVVTVLKAEFRMGEEQAHRVMMTAHRRGACVVAVYTKDVAEAKATRATDAGRQKGYPLMFTTEPEEGRPRAVPRANPVIASRGHPGPMYPVSASRPAGSRPGRAGGTPDLAEWSRAPASRPSGPSTARVISR